MERERDEAQDKWSLKTAAAQQTLATVLLIKSEGKHIWQSPLRHTSSRNDESLVSVRRSRCGLGGEIRVFCGGKKWRNFWAGLPSARRSSISGQVIRAVRWKRASCAWLPRKIVNLHAEANLLRHIPHTREGCTPKRMLAMRCRWIRLASMRLREMRKRRQNVGHGVGFRNKPQGERPVMMPSLCSPVDSTWPTTDRPNVRSRPLFLSRILPLPFQPGSNPNPWL